MPALFDTHLHPHGRDGRFSGTFHSKVSHAPQFGDERPDLIGSPGRSGKGRLRNFGAMTDQKLAGVLYALIDHPIHDPDAIHAAQAEAGKRTGKKITEAARRAGMRNDTREATFGAKTREKLAEKGVAMPDGSFPIRNGGDLDNAVQALGRAKDPGRAKAHIKKRAKALGLSHKLPDDWGVREASMTPRERAMARRIEAVEQRMIEEAADSLAKASTPEPFSTSKTSNWVARGGGLPDYIQHVAHGLVRRGMPESKAISMAIGIVKRWARGGGKVDAGTRAAAAKAVAEWERLKAENAAKTAAKAAS